MEIIERPTPPIEAQALPRIEYEHGAHDPWRSLVNLAAIFGMIHGIVLTCTGGEIISILYHQGSNMLVNLFFLGRVTMINTVAHLGELFAGVLLTVSSVQCITVRRGGRWRFIICVVVGYLSVLLLDLQTLQFGQYWRYHWRVHGFTAAMAAVLRLLLTPLDHAIVPAILVWIMTRPQVKARFESSRVQHV